MERSDQTLILLSLKEQVIIMHALGEYAANMKKGAYALDKVEEVEALHQRLKDRGRPS